MIHVFYLFLFSSSSFLVLVLLFAYVEIFSVSKVRDLKKKKKIVGKVVMGVKIVDFTFFKDMTAVCL